MLSTHEEQIELPAEWEAQSGILLTWPHTESDWKNNLDEIGKVYLDMCKAISQYQKLLIICYDKQHKEMIENLFKDHAIAKDAYQLSICKTNDTWFRDYGPITVRCDGSLQLQNFIFNSWGNKYHSDLDNAVSRHLYKENYFDENQMKDCDFVLEGGSVESDGHGTILTTSHCLLKRHPDKTKKDVEKLLNNYLGATKVLWLDHGGITGDDTDSHIDNLARFVDKHTIVYCACDDVHNPDHDSLKLMEAELKALSDNEDKPYNLIPLLMPKNIKYDGQSLPASYANFLIINQADLVPVYNVPEDKNALEVLQKCFPERRIIGINSTAMIKQFGSLHCASMQLPAGVLH
jgi:agmatine deiminase